MRSITTKNQLLFFIIIKLNDFHKSRGSVFMWTLTLKCFRYIIASLTLTICLTEKIHILYIVKKNTEEESKNDQRSVGKTSFTSASECFILAVTTKA